jgi:tRNA(His) 5'-end guanylyltransferase
MKSSKALCILLAFALLLGSIAADGQQYNRIRADFSVKVKNASGGQSLTIGQVFYDRNNKQIIYYVTFPDHEMWVTSDTTVFQFRDGKLISRTATFAMAEFTVFHLALNSRLQDFGLRNTRYSVKDIAREGDMVITSWMPPEKAREYLGTLRCRFSRP